MIEYIVYTSEGCTLGPKNSVEIENCQVLGFIDGNAEDDAIRKLFEQNEWIEKSGFSIDKALARPLLTSSIKEDIREVIDYLLKDESRHFEENNRTEGHIFQRLKRLKGTIYRI